MTDETTVAEGLLRTIEQLIEGSTIQNELILSLASRLTVLEEDKRRRDAQANLQR